MKRTITGSLLLALSCFFIFISCNKIDTTNIGDGLIPVVDNINTFDTVLEVISDNFLMEDSSRVSASENHALGYISNDPIFGKTTAAIYAHFQPGTFNAASPFHDSLAGLDSVVLSLQYKTTFGDTNSTGRFSIYEVSQNERTNLKDSVYPVSIPYFETASLLGTHDQDFFRLNDVDTILEGKVKKAVSYQMRMRLDNTFGQRFFDYDTSVYRNDSTFSDKFLAFAIIPDSNFAASNALAYFNLRDTGTKLSFYYRATQNGNIDTFVTSFTVSGFATANIIRRNISGTEYEAAINNGIPADEKIYIATSPGSFALLQIPGLRGLSNRVVHRADLIVEKVPSVGEEFAPPERLFLDLYDSAVGLPRSIQNDFIFDNSSSTLYNTILLGGNLKNDKYVFNISRYVQGIVSRNDTVFPLRLYAPYTTRIPYIQDGIPQDQINLTTQPKFTFPVLPYIANGRLVAAGGNYTNAAQRIRLRIIYSKL